MNRVIPKGTRPVAIVGTTASGKSALALALARRHPEVELVSVDSMQVYRGMDIGTAKPTPAEQAEVRHHLIDVVDPWEPFEVHSFQRLVADALADIAGRGNRAILVGGTGLYLQAVIDGFEIPGRFPDVAAELEAEPDTEALHRRLAEIDPVAAARMEPTNRRRVMRALSVTLGSGRPFSSFGPGVDAHPPTPVRLIGIRHPPEVTAERIAVRYQQQLADGFVDEVRRLASGPPLSRTAAQALGYRELLAHLRATEPELWSRGGADAAPDAIRSTRATRSAAVPMSAPGAPGGTGEPGKPEHAAAADGVERAGGAEHADETSKAERAGDTGEASDAGGAAPWAGSLEATIDEAIGRTRQFARRQRSWFRRDPRITWLDSTADAEDLVDPVTRIVEAHWA